MQKFWIVGTGFSRGIGLELAKQIKAQGYLIFHIGRNKCGFEDEFLSSDLSAPPSLEFFKSFHAKLLTKNILGFFYSAGLFPALTYDTDNPKQKMEFWESQTRTMQVNYLSCAVLLEELLPHLLKSTHKNEKEHKKKNASISPFIAHFSSLAAVDPLPAFEFYGITKTATLKYFEDFAKRFNSKQLSSFSIHPGTVRTDMVESIMNPKEHQHLPVIKIFRTALAENRLISAQESAQSVADFLFHKDYAGMRAKAHGKLYLADSKKIF